MLISINNISATNATVNSTSYKTTADLTAPTVKSTDPTNKATNVAVNKAIKVTFSESIKKGTGWIELKTSSGKSVAVTTSISGNTLTITPKSSLTKGTTYVLYVHSKSITDLSGNKYVYSGSKTFKTDGTAPTIKSTSPTNKATNVAVNKAIKVTFSESIKKGTGWIELKTSSGKSVAVTTSISGNTLTITPKSNLTPGTKYTLLIHSGTVTDLSGNKYVYAGSKTFKTKSENMQAVWLPSSYVTYNTLNVTKLTKMGITDVFVKVSQTNYKSVLTSIFSKVSGTGINIHAWITCFYYNGSWINPQKNTTYVNSLISFISSVTKYSVNGKNVDGIHLDYVRYPGTAYKYTGATATITSFVQKVYNTVKAIDSSVAVSAALMPEGSVNAYYYGQNYTQLSNYLDFLVPMIYKGNYGYDSSTGTNSKGSSGTNWIASKVSYIVSQANGKPVIAGLQTYRSDNDVTAISASELQNDINAAISNGASGYALFRYGLIDDDL
ncbi:Ig-like domain-containing protein [Methanobacterium bryantii]|uniref:SbsA Ig-like domain-containing protein n=2 Tax=Methanobacterium TaxID=2160 RepID=A0A2A2H1K9_METBR|nr:Ig-like domain-containing protein [Methanobacterium bryantii]PAV03204.1 hypothetical protein ASJ80_04160 [Methanobacterium bryantii]